MPIQIIVNTTGIDQLANDLMAFSSKDLSQALYEAAITYAIPAAQQNATMEFNVRTGFYSTSFDAVVIGQNLVEVSNAAPYANRLENEIFRYAGGPHMVLYTAALETVDAMSQFIGDWLQVNEFNTWGQS